MDLLTPGWGLIVWQLVTFAGLILFVMSWVIILTTKLLDSRARFFWLLGTLVLPLIGPILFLVKHNYAKKAAAGRG